MVMVPVSVGELIDKYSILQIKKSKVTDDKVPFVEKEMQSLLPEVSKYIRIDAISILYEDLIGVNVQLWEIEDKLRKMEKEKKFDEEFVTSARSVYHLNDERFNIKSKINRLTDSEIREVKQHIEYR